MEQLIRQYIWDNRLLQNGQTIIVALSGGMDSVALFYVLNNLKEELGISLICAHYDHGIRETAKRDALFAQELAERHNVPFYLGKGDVPKYAKEKNISIEMAARECRYDFLYKIKNKTGADYIATAHHKTDQVETVLLNIIRGSGTLGLSGMKNNTEDIIRPFLCVTRDQIHEYILKNEMPYVQDETNDDKTYKRNRIRHELVPILKTYNPSIDDAIVRLAEISSCDEDFIASFAEKSMSKMFSFENNEYILLRKPFVNQHLSIKRAILRLILKEINCLKDMSFGRLAEMLNFIENSNTGSIFIINNHYKILHDYDKLYFAENDSSKTPKNGTSSPLIIKEGIYKTTFGVFRLEITDVLEAFKQKGEYFDLEKLKKYDAVFRYRQDGDFIKPLGGHTKKLKDYFIDKKTPKRERDRVVLLASEKEVLWAVDNCISDKIKIDECTRKCVHIIFEGKK